jgi:uncharacterized protein
MQKRWIVAFCAAGLVWAAGKDHIVADAAQRGDQPAVRALAAAKADINGAQGDGMTALHWAAANDDLDMARLLIAAGADVKAVTRVQGNTPLMTAAATGDSDLLEALLKAGADPNAANALGTTALMTAASSGNVLAIGALLVHGAEPDAREGAHGQTALMFAAADDRGPAIRTLLAHGATAEAITKVEQLDKPSVDEDGNPLPKDRPRAANPAYAAAMARRATANKIGGLTALLIAARQGNLAAVTALADAGVNLDHPSDSDKTSPLVMAIINGHYDVARYLLERGADPNQVTADGLAPLYAMEDTQFAPVGWSPNPITNQEKTGYLELMKELLDRGANPNTRLAHKLWFRPNNHDQLWIGTAGSTAFWRAAQATDLRAMHLLVEHGADPKIPSAEGVTALGVAAGLGWAGNFSINAPDTPLETARYCLELGIDVNVQDAQGYTTLMGAAYRGENELVKLLVAKGAKLDPKTGRGWSVTDMANGPSLRSSVPMAHPDTVALLLSLGAPQLTAVEGEEILGIIRRRPAPKTETPAEKTPETKTEPATIK